MPTNMSTSQANRCEQAPTRGTKRKVADAGLAGAEVLHDLARFAGVWVDPACDVWPRRWTKLSLRANLSLAPIPAVWRHEVRHQGTKRRCTVWDGAREEGELGERLTLFRAAASWAAERAAMQSRMRDLQAEVSALQWQLQLQQQQQQQQQQQHQQQQQQQQQQQHGAWVADLTDAEPVAISTNAADRMDVVGGQEVREVEAVAATNNAATKSLTWPPLAFHVHGAEERMADRVRAVAAKPEDRRLPDYEEFEKDDGRVTFPPLSNGVPVKNSGGRVTSAPWQAELLRQPEAAASLSGIMEGIQRLLGGSNTNGEAPVNQRRRPTALEVCEAVEEPLAATTEPSAQAAEEGAEEEKDDISSLASDHPPPPELDDDGIAEIAAGMNAIRVNGLEREEMAPQPEPQQEPELQPSQEPESQEDGMAELAAGMTAIRVNGPEKDEEEEEEEL